MAKYIVTNKTTPIIKIWDEINIMMSHLLIYTPNMKPIKDEAKGLENYYPVWHEYILGFFYDEGILYVVTTFAYIYI